MKRKVSILIAMWGVLLVLCSPMWAHHSAVARYDREHPITVSGTVREYIFANPHIQILFDVKDENGNVATWTGEGMAPADMVRAGWVKNTLKPGDQVSITGWPSKKGEKTMHMLKIVGPGGKQYQQPEKL
jgi:uncharacterized protein DUF6152